MSYIGIDVSAKTRDVAVEGGALWQVRNDDGSIAHLVAQLVALTPRVIVLEPTARYHRR